MMGPTGRQSICEKPPQEKGEKSLWLARGNVEPDIEPTKIRHTLAGDGQSKERIKTVKEYYVQYGDQLARLKKTALHLKNEHAEA